MSPDIFKCPQGRKTDLEGNVGGVAFSRQASLVPLEGRKRDDEQGKTAVSGSWNPGGLAALGDINKVGETDRAKPQACGNIREVRCTTYIILA